MYLCSRIIKHNNMNTQLLIKDFRVFDESGVRIDIKPLTILTGCNSSGKSSIVKAAFLLNSFMKQVNEAIEKGLDIQLSKYKLDFTSYPNNLLGRFDKVIPKGATSPKMTLGYTAHSCMLSKDVNVQLVFAANKNDDLNNAYLVSISMSTDEGIFYSSDNENGSTCNLNIIKKYCPDFVKIESLINNYSALYSLYHFSFEETVSDEEFESKRKNIFESLREFDRNKVIDVANYIRKQTGSYSCIAKNNKTSLFEWTEKNHSYFNIPVLEYLRTIKKDNLKDIVEKELLYGKEDDALCARPKAIASATNKVINDFVQSGFDTIDEYFKDFEQRHFDNISNKSDNECPCMLNICLNQGYTVCHPESYVSVDWADDGEETQHSEDEKERIKLQSIKKWEEKPITFDILYEVVMLWNEKFTSVKSEYYREGSSFSTGSRSIYNYPDGFHHYTFEMLATFAKQVAEEVICPGGFENMSYVSSSRATVKKLYALDGKDDFTELLQRYFEEKLQYQERTLKLSSNPDYEANSFMNKWIQQFGLGESLSFQLDEEGLGVKIRLHKSADDSGRLLSDEGYGITQLISILLQIETAILSAKGKKVQIDFALSSFDKYDTNVFHFEENTIAIEEPEIHLHPSYQSKLAEMFVEAYSKYNIHFIIETHSEYLIRKFQTFVAHGKMGNDTISLNYIYSPEDYVSPSDSRVKHIPIKEDGSLADSFGSGFFDEADNLSVELMSIKI